IARRQHSHPRNEWISDCELVTRRRVQGPGHMENIPEPAERAPGLRCHRVKTVVQSDHGHAKAGDYGHRKINQPGQNDHRPADRPKNTDAYVMEIEIEFPAEAADIRDLQEGQPETPAE